jgi:hypothetical protein
MAVLRPLLQLSCWQYRDKELPPLLLLPLLTLPLLDPPAVLGATLLRLLLVGALL